MITIVDYGAGNLRSLQNAFRHLGYEVACSSSAKQVARADKLIMPGVGAFGYAMRNLNELGLIDPLRRKALAGAPLLGICLGMQLLLTESEEGGRVQGLDLIAGRVRRFKVDLKVPHIGWNEIRAEPGSSLLRGLPDSRYAYFVHSYVCHPAEPESTVATCEYGVHFCAAFESRNIFGVQFHPEKSQELGLRILQNFAEL